MAVRRRDRQVTANELALWRDAVRSTRPLRPGDGAKGPEQTAPAGPAATGTGDVVHQEPATPVTRSRHVTSRTPVQPGPALDPNRPIGLDRRTWQRLRAGRLPIEARLDLHGDTQEMAHRRLQGFLADCQASGRRCVLVVTGKGRAGGGILRHMVPRWLGEPGVRERLVAYTPAGLEHGGSGALYVLLRRRRSGP